MRTTWLYNLFALVLVLVSCGLTRAQTSSGSSVLRLDPALDKLISPNAKLEDVLIDRFARDEGPVWVRGNGMSGYLLIPDVAGNLIYKWQPTCRKYPCPPTAGTLSVFLRNASYTGPVSPSGFPGKAFGDVGTITYNGRFWVVHTGPVGLGLDPQGRLLITEFGDRAVARLESDGTRTVLASSWQGKHLNCPDDLVSKSDGTIYWTDGPQSCYRLGETDPSREIQFKALYMIKDGVVSVLDQTNPGINGVALSPDEKTLYVTGGHDTLLKYDVQSDDTVTNRRLFIDMLASSGLTHPKPGTADAIFPDGVRVDSKGDVWTPGPGGIWVISPEGKHLGTILAPNDPALLQYQVFCSLTFGDDGKTLYIDGNTDVRRIRLRVCGSSLPPFTCAGE
jgi:gluconolactonase